MAYSIVSPDLKEELDNAIVYGLKSIGFEDEDVKEIYSLMSTPRSRKSMYSKILEKSLSEQKPFRIVGFSELMKAGTIKDITNNIEYSKNDLKSYNSDDFNKLYKDILKVESDIADRYKSLQDLEGSIKDLDKQLNDIETSIDAATIDAGNISGDYKVAREYNKNKLYPYAYHLSDKQDDGIVKFKSSEDLASAENEISSKDNPVNPSNPVGMSVQRTLDKITGLEDAALKINEGMQKMMQETQAFEKEMSRIKNEMDAIQDKNSPEFNILAETYDDKVSKYNEHLQKLNKLVETYKSVTERISNIINGDKLKAIVDYAKISDLISESSLFLQQHEKTLKDFPTSSLMGRLGILESFYTHSGKEEKLRKIRKLTDLLNEFSDERVFILSTPGLNPDSIPDFDNDVLRKYYFGILNGKVPVGFNIDENDRKKIEEAIKIKEELDNDFNKIADIVLSDKYLIHSIDRVFDEDGNINKEIKKGSKESYDFRRGVYHMLKPLWNEIHNEGGIFYGKSDEEIKNILKDETFKNLYKTFILGIGPGINNKDIEYFKERYGLKDYEGGSALEVGMKSLASSMSLSIYIPDLEKHFPTALSMALYGEDVVKRVSDKLAISSGYGMIMGTAITFLVGSGILNLAKVGGTVSQVMNVIGMSKRIQNFLKTAFGFFTLHTLNSYTEALMESRFQEKEIKDRIDSNKEIYGILKDILKNNSQKYDFQHRKKVEEVLNMAYYNADLYAEKSKDYVFDNQFKFLFFANIAQDAISYYLLGKALNSIKFLNKTTVKPFSFSFKTAGPLKYPVINPASFLKFSLYNLKDTFRKPSFIGSVISFGTLESAQEVAQDYLNASIYYTYLDQMNDSFMSSALSRDRRWYATLNSSEVNWVDTMVTSAISGVLAASTFGILGAAAGTLGYRSYKKKIHTFNHVLSSYHSKLSGFVKFDVNPDNTLSMSVDNSLMTKMTHLLTSDEFKGSEDIDSLKKFVLETSYLLQVSNELGITGHLSEYANTVLRVLNELKQYLTSTDKDGNIGVSNAVKAFNTLSYLNIKLEGLEGTPSHTEIYEFFNKNKKEIVNAIDETIPTIDLFVKSLKDLSSSMKGNNAIARVLKAMKNKGGYESVLEEIRKHFGFKTIDDLINNVDSIDSKKINEFQKNLEKREETIYSIFEDIFDELYKTYDKIYYSVGKKGDVLNIYVYNAKDNKYYRVTVSGEGVKVDDKPSDTSNLKMREINERNSNEIGIPFIVSQFATLSFSEKTKMLNRLSKTVPKHASEIEEYLRHLNTLSVISYLYALRPYLETIYFTDHVLEKIAPYLNSMGYDAIRIGLNTAKIQIKYGSDEISFTVEDLLVKNKYYQHTLMLYLKRSEKLAKDLLNMLEDTDGKQEEAKEKDEKRDEQDTRRKDIESLIKIIEDLISNLERHKYEQKPAKEHNTFLQTYIEILNKFRYLIEIEDLKSKESKERTQIEQKLKDIKKEYKSLVKILDLFVKIKFSEHIDAVINNSVGRHEGFLKLITTIFNYLINYSPRTELELTSTLSEVLGVIEGKEKEYKEVIDYIVQESKKLRDRVDKGNLDRVTYKLRGRNAASLREAILTLSKIMKFISIRYVNIPSIHDMVNLKEINEHVKIFKGFRLGRTEKGKLYMKTPEGRKVIFSDFYLYGLLLDYSPLYNVVEFLRKSFGPENVEVIHPDNPSDSYMRYVEGFGIVDGMLEILSLDVIPGKRHYNGKVFRRAMEDADKNNPFAVSFDAVSVFDPEESTAYMDRFRKVHEMTYLRMLENNKESLSVIESLNLRLRNVEPSVILRRRVIRNIKNSIKKIRKIKGKIGSENLNSFIKELRARIRNSSFTNILSDKVRFEEIEGTLSSLSYADLNAIDNYLDNLLSYGTYYEMAVQDLNLDKNEVSFVTFLNHAEHYINMIFIKFLKEPDVYKKYKIRNVNSRKSLLTDSLGFFELFIDPENADLHLSSLFGILKNYAGLFKSLNIPYNPSVFFRYLGIRILVVENEADKLKYGSHYNAIVLSKNELNSLIHQVIEDEYENILKVIKSGGIPKYYIAYKVLEPLILKSVVQRRGLLPAAVSVPHEAPKEEVIPKPEKEEIEQPIQPVTERKSTLLKYITENISERKKVSGVNHFRLIEVILGYIDREDIRMADSVSNAIRFIQLLSSFGIQERKSEKMVSHEVVGTDVSVLADFFEKIKGVYKIETYPDIDAYAIFSVIREMYASDSGNLSLYEVAINAFLNLMADRLYDKTHEVADQVSELYYHRKMIVNHVHGGKSIGSSEAEKYRSEADKVFHMLYYLVINNTENLADFFKDLYDVMEDKRSVEEIIESIEQTAMKSGVDNHGSVAVDKFVTIYSSLVDALHSMNSEAMKKFIKTMMGIRPGDVNDVDSFLKPFIDEFVSEFNSVNDFFHITSGTGGSVVLQRRNTSVLNISNIVHVDYGPGGAAAGNMEVRRGSRVRSSSSFFTDPVQNDIFTVWSSNPGTTVKVKIGGAPAKGRRVLSIYYGDRSKTASQDHFDDVKGIYIYRRSPSYGNGIQEASIPEGNYKFLGVKLMDVVNHTHPVSSSIIPLIERYIKAIENHIAWVRSIREQYGDVRASLFGFIEKEAFSFRDFKDMTVDGYIKILEERIKTLNELKNFIPDRGFAYAERCIVLNKDLIENENIVIEVRDKGGVVKSYSFGTESGKEGSLKDQGVVDELIDRLMKGASYKVYNVPPVRVAVTAESIESKEAFTSSLEIKDARIIYEVPVIRYQNDRTLGKSKNILKFTDSEFKSNAEIAAALKVFDNIITSSLMEIGSFRFFIKGGSGSLFDETYSDELENILSSFENATPFIQMDSLLFKTEIPKTINDFIYSEYVVNPNASDISDEMSKSFKGWSHLWFLASYVDGISGSHMRFRERKVSYKLSDSNVHINDVYHQAPNSTRRFIIQSYRDEKGRVIFENAFVSRGGVVIEGYGSEEPVDVVLNVDDSNVDLLDTQTFFHLSHLTSSYEGDGTIIIQNNSGYNFVVFDVEEALKSGNVHDYLKSFLSSVKGKPNTKIVIILPSHYFENKGYSFKNKSYRYESIIIRRKGKAGDESYVVDRNNPIKSTRAEDLKVVLGDLHELMIAFREGTGNEKHIEHIADGIVTLLDGEYAERKKEVADKETKKKKKESRKTKKETEEVEKKKQKPKEKKKQKSAEKEEKKEEKKKEKPKTEKSKEKAGKKKEKGKPEKSPEPETVMKPEEKKTSAAEENIPAKQKIKEVMKEKSKKELKKLIRGAVRVKEKSMEVAEMEEKFKVFIIANAPRLIHKLLEEAAEKLPSFRKIKVPDIKELEEIVKNMLDGKPVTFTSWDSRGLKLGEVTMNHAEMIEELSEFLYEVVDKSQILKHKKDVYKDINGFINVVLDSRITDVLENLYTRVYVKSLAAGLSSKQSFLLGFLGSIKDYNKNADVAEIFTSVVLAGMYWNILDEYGSYLYDFLVETYTVTDESLDFIDYFIPKALNLSIFKYYTNKTSPEDFREVTSGFTASKRKLVSVGGTDIEKLAKSTSWYCKGSNIKKP